MDPQAEFARPPASKGAVAYRHIPSFRFATPPRREPPPAPQRSITAEGPLNNQVPDGQAPSTKLDSGDAQASAQLSVPTDTVSSATSVSTASATLPYSGSHVDSRGGSVGTAFREGHTIMPSPKTLSRRRMPAAPQGADKALDDTCASASSGGYPHAAQGPGASEVLRPTAYDSIPPELAPTVAKQARTPAGIQPASQDSITNLTSASALRGPGQASFMDVPEDIIYLLSQAYDEDPNLEGTACGASGFRWSGMVDAAHAAWIGGTQLLRYGEILPGGGAKAIAWLLSDGELPTADASSSAGPPPSFLGDHSDSGRQLVLELGMGRGRLALQLFLSGATVIGVELASERYGLAVAALERLVHRFPEDFEISKRTAEALRVRRRGGPKGAICEIRLGSFFDMVSPDEMAAATMVFFQVFLPPPTWPRVRNLYSSISPGCRVLSYENLRRIWSGEGGLPLEVTIAKPFPFIELGSPLLACSWAPGAGHRFHCYKCVPLGNPYSEATVLQQQATEAMRAASQAASGDNTA
mmetsp:Transcript_62158/g.103237  ORF Transcript_62158/g.103237 Transcript_62158/m.103237 type:complete len:527 (-) Transcript_62158:100-1680(-)